MNIIDAVSDKNLFKSFMGNSLKTWNRWAVALQYLYSLSLKSKHSKLITKCTGRDYKLMPLAEFDTTLFLAGRYSGKSRIPTVIGPPQDERERQRITE